MPRETEGGETVSVQAARTLWQNAVSPESSPTVSIRSPASLHMAETLRVRPATRRLDTGGAAARGDQPGDFEILKLLGEGGMGVVYSARQVSLNRAIALKMIRPEESRDDRNVSKFLAEAVVTGGLDHPNIVPVYDVGGTPDGKIFYAMKEVAGTSWARVLRAKSLDENLRILLSVADAVAFAHARGIIHRDLKPENVMLGEYGEVLVMDWGLAYPVSGALAGQMSSPGLAGTPAYMAPEMAHGQFDRIGFASDVYLLGGILYEIVTGLRPHTGKDVYTCIAAAQENAIQASNQRGELVNTALKALATDPRSRHASVKEFQEAIRDYLAHAESLRLSAAGDARLAKLPDAAPDAVYREVTETIACFQQSLQLWGGNEAAFAGLLRAREMLADVALSRGDLALAESETSAMAEEVERHGAGPDAQNLVGKLRKHVRQAVAAARTRRRLLRFSVATAIFAALAALIITGQAYLVARTGRDVSQRAEEQALRERDRAHAAEMTLQQRNAELQNAFDRIGQESYLNSIALAERQVRDGRPDAAEEILWSTAAPSRGWEWGALLALCRRTLAILGPQASAVQCVALASDGSEALTVGTDSSVRLWNVLTGKTRLLFDSEPSPIVSGVFAADGRRVFTCTREGFLEIWDRQTGERQTSRQMPGFAAAGAPVFSSTGRFILNGGADGRLRIWTAETAQETLATTLFNAAGEIGCIALHPDGRQTLVQYGTQAPGLWNLQTGALERSLYFEGLAGPLNAAALFKDGQRILATSGGMWAGIWSLSTGKRLQQLGGHTDVILSAALSGDGLFAITGSADRTARVWDARSGDAFLSLLGHTAGLSSVTVSTDGRRVITASEDGTARLWNANGGREILVLSGHAGPVTGAGFLADGRRAVTAGQDGTIRVWNTSAGAEEGRFNGQVGPVLALALSSNGTCLAVAGKKALTLWNTAALRMLFATNFVNEAARQICFTPDGKALAVAAMDTQFLDAESGALLRVLDKTETMATALAFAPDGKRIATGMRQGITVRDAASGAVLLRMPGPAVSALAFAPDGRRLLAAGLRKLAAWDTSNGRLLAEFTAHDGWVTSLAFAPGGTRLLSAGDDFVARVWVALNPFLPRKELEEQLRDLASKRLQASGF